MPPTHSFLFNLPHTFQPFAFAGTFTKRINKLVSCKTSPHEREQIGLFSDKRPICLLYYVKVCNAPLTLQHNLIQEKVKNPFTKLNL